MIPILLDFLGGVTIDGSCTLGGVTGVPAAPGGGGGGGVVGTVSTDWTGAGTGDGVNNSGGGILPGGADIEGTEGIVD
jgi:hypothetical protein